MSLVSFSVSKGGVLALKEVLLWSMLNLNANITLQSYMSLDAQQTSYPYVQSIISWGLKFYVVFFIRTPRSLSSKGPSQMGHNDSQ